MPQFRRISYTQLPTDPEAGPSGFPSLKKSGPSRLAALLSFVLRPGVILSICIISIIIILLDIRSKTWHEPVYIFDKEARPAWLDSPHAAEPLILRVAVISHPSEVERRQLIRDSVFKGVPSKEVQIDYRFFLGIPERNGSFWEETPHDIWEEEQRHKDMVILDFPDTPERISQKRYAALKWANSFANASYDYFMTMDSDTFVRFKALARRIAYTFENQTVNPRTQAVMIGRMKPCRNYWLNAVSDAKNDTLEEDTLIAGPKYQYPVGIGYMLSSFLVETLLSARPSIPHHVHYPHDDEMIGSWVASLENYARSEVTFRYKEHDGWNIFTKVAHPEPLVPSPVDTLVIDDHGWHDYPGRKYGHKFEGSIGWNSVCIHHIRTHEIPMLRYMDEFRGEWENLETWSQNPYPGT